MSQLYDRLIEIKKKSMKRIYDLYKKAEAEGTLKRVDLCGECHHRTQCDIYAHHHGISLSRYRLDFCTDPPTAEEGPYV